MEKHKIMLTIIAGIFLVMASMMVSAFNSGDITVHRLDEIAYINDTNFTVGILFEWQDTEDNTYNTSDCSLYLKNDTYDGIVANSSRYATVSHLNESTNWTFYMNSLFPKNSTIYYYVIQCGNTSSIHSNQTTTPPRIIYTDITYPVTTDNSRSATNSSWQNGVFRQELTITDLIAAAGQSFQCKILNNSNNYSFAASDAVNGTPINITTSLEDGNYSLIGACYDHVGNQNVTGVLSFYQDGTNPSASWLSSTPSEGSLVDISPTDLYINFSITEININTITLDVNGTNYTIVYAANCTTINSTLGTRWCQVVEYDYANGNDVYLTLHVNDTVGNSYVLGPRTFTIDNASLTINPGGKNLSIASSVATFNATVAGISPESCLVKMYNRNGVNYENVSATLGTGTSTARYCSGTIDVSNMNLEGKFYMTYAVTSEAGNVTLGGNQTGVYKVLKEGWNLLTWTDVNITTGDACQKVDGCSQVSLYNNTGKTFKTYSTSTPSANNATNFTSGDAILMYVTEDTEIIMNNNLPAQNSPGTNISLYTVGWNTIGLITNGSINSTLQDNAYEGAKNVTWVSYFNASAGKFYSCPRAYDLCTSAGGRLAKGIKTNLGDAIWALTDANITINRSYLED